MNDFPTISGVQNTQQLFLSNNTSALLELADTTSNELKDEFEYLKENKADYEDQFNDDSEEDENEEDEKDDEQEEISLNSSENEEYHTVVDTIKASDLSEEEVIEISEDLSEEIKQLDRDTINNIPILLKSIGMAVCRLVK